MRKSFGGSFRFFFQSSPGLIREKKKKRHQILNISILNQHSQHHLHFLKDLLDDSVGCGCRLGVAVVDCAGGFDLGWLHCLGPPSTSSWTTCWLHRASHLAILIRQSQNQWILHSGCTHYLNILSSKQWVTNNSRDNNCKLSFPQLSQCPKHTQKNKIS